MKILVLLTLFVSFAVFAKPDINYSFIPKDANIVGYISTKSLMGNKFVKKMMNEKDAKNAIDELNKMGIDVKKIGSVFFYSTSDSLMKNKGKNDLKDVDFAMILNGISLEKVIKSKVNLNKNAKIETYKGIAIYKDLSVEMDDEKMDAVTFIKSNTILGSLNGVKKVVASYVDKNFTKNDKMINNLYSTLKSPEFFVVNIINNKQKVLISKTIKENQANPVVAMLGLAELSKTVKYFGISSKLTGNKVEITLAVSADKASVTTFANMLNTQFKSFKPMIEQQITAYGQTLGADGVKELKSILSSVKIQGKNDLALLSFSINIENTVKIMDKLKKEGHKNDNQMMKNMKRKK
jgi:hypothetical protein